LPFWGRPFSVIRGERFATALQALIEDERVRRIPLLIGGIDLWSDSTDLLEAAELRARVESLYRD
jgi:hypothetical protein